ncbi:MAG: hypothetical protein PUP92_15140 [Rhizonema sp. PD38]|nr:hypothetical protein [Rhizonema sp. PD38]
MIQQSAKSSSKFFALLIGVDCYLPNIQAQGGFYSSLAGCVRDINHGEPEGRWLPLKRQGCFIPLGQEVCQSY